MRKPGWEKQKLRMAGVQNVATSNGKKAKSKQSSCFSKSYCVKLKCSTPTRLVSVPVGERNLVPVEPAEGATTGLIVEADPEGVVSTAEHQAVGEGLLEP